MKVHVSVDAGDDGAAVVEVFERWCVYAHSVPGGRGVARVEFDGVHVCELSDNRSVDLVDLPGPVRLAVRRVLRKLP